MPFEMSLDVSQFADAIICDYNYVFDPDVCLKRFFSNNDTDGRKIRLSGKMGKTVLLCWWMKHIILLKGHEICTVRQSAGKLSGRQRLP